MAGLVRSETLIIGECAVRKLKTLALIGYPYEVCGIINEGDAINQYPNIFCGNKQHGFDMEVDIHDPSIKAVWHSHPSGSTVPSDDDIPAIKSLADHGFYFPWLIVTESSVTQWIWEEATLQSRLQSTQKTN